MLFAIGSKVHFRFTGESGTITAQLADGMLQVRLDSDRSMEIPAFEDDLIRDASREPVSPGAKFVPGKVEKTAPPPPRREIKSQYVILKSMGIQLGFEPMPGRDGQVSKFKAWLINDTPHDVFVEFQLFVLGGKKLELTEKLAANTALDAGDMMLDDLNDAPEVKFSCQRFTTAGMDAAQEKNFKIKTKSFFNSFRTAPILNLPVYHYVLVENVKSGEEKKPAPAEDLKSYTKQKVRENKAENIFADIFVPYETFNVEEFAEFLPEIDLHIEKLVNGFMRVDKTMAMRMQLTHFEKFMDKAIRLGVPRVFVIHGVGEGKLKDAIAKKLRDYPEVHKFKNEYHAKYGYGATEVIFR